tara:strand:- start:1649 stop:2278 length:630 start_codon:yes stop_codon:yes gene_type:complete
MDYTTLVANKATDGSIRNWVNNDSFSATTILSEAEDFIYRRLRVREMLKLTTGNMVVGQDYIDVPTDFIGSRSLFYSGTEKLAMNHTTLDAIEAGRTYDTSGNITQGKPTQFYIDADKAFFPIAPDQTYAYRWRYYCQPTALSSTNTTNFLTNFSPRLLRCVCLAMANEFLKNDGDKLYWLRLAEGEIEVLHKADDEVRWDLDVSVVVT